MALEKLFRTNKSLTSLYIDFNNTLKNRDLKLIFRGIRNYSTTLEILSVSDIALSLKQFDTLSRILGEKKPHVPIRSLMIARCQINATYLVRLPTIMRTSPMCLRHLDISGNPLEDDGVKVIRF